MVRYSRGRDRRSASPNAALRKSVLLRAVAGEFTLYGMAHPLLDVMLDAARGSFPPANGAVTFLPGLPGGNRAVLALTGHAFVAADLDAGDFADITIDGFGAVLAPAAVLRLAADGDIGVNDVTLVAPGTGTGMTSPSTTVWDDHPRVPARPPPPRRRRRPRRRPWIRDARRGACRTHGDEHRDR